jgi:hypothetical protein
MVYVSLYQLVLIRGTRHLWPDWFQSFCCAIERDPSDRLSYHLVADKCDEEGEPELAAIFRWFCRHPEVLLTDELTSRPAGYGIWHVRNLPKALQSFEAEVNEDDPQSDEWNPVYRIVKTGKVIDEVRAQL